MKKMMLVMFLLTFAGISAMGYIPAKASFYSEDGRSMRVFIDGKLINTYPRQFVSVSNLRPGKHRVVFEVYNRRGRKIKARDRIVLRAGLETRFAVGLKGSNRLVVDKIGSTRLGKGHRQYRKDTRGDYGRRRHTPRDHQTSCPTYGRYRF